MIEIVKKPDLMLPKLQKLVINISVGSDVQKLKSIRAKLMDFFVHEPIELFAKTTIKKFDIRRGKKMGYKYVYFGNSCKKVFHKIISTIPMGRDLKNGNMDWGI